jgi:hypothetical protein
MADSRLASKAAITRATKTAHRKMNTLDADLRRELKRIYKQGAEAISERITAFAGSDDNLELAQLQDLLQQINQRLAVLSRARNSLIETGLQRATRIGVEPLVPVINSLAAMQVSDEALRFVRTFVDADGLQLSDRIWRLDRQARDMVVNAVEQAVIQGYSAGQAARELLLQGKPVPLDVQQKINAAKAGKVAQEAASHLTTGAGAPLDNALRVMRTEINRAHGEAYMEGGKEHPDFAGWRYLLSPAHPRPDICDLHSSANLYGLGRGVYPNREKCPWPAHPNILSYIEIVFKDEVTDADRAGKETPMQALERLSPAQQRGVLGAHKYQVFKEGRLTQGMIKSPWKKVRQRIGDLKPKPPAPPRAPSPSRKSAQSLDEMIAGGAPIADELIAASRRGDGSVDGARMLEQLHGRLKEARPIMTEAKIANAGKGAALVKAASQMFPDDWTKAADRYGPLHVKYSQSRGGQVSLPSTSAGRPYRIMGFTGVARGGDGFIRTRGFSTSLHEYAHRLQHAIPGLDAYFQELHGRRTAGDPLRRLRDLFPGMGYDTSEKTREDKYRHAYQGKEYSGAYYLGKHGALEVLTMAFEDVLGGQSYRLEELIEKDREMLNLVLGLLFHYVP